MLLLKAGVIWLSDSSPVCHSDQHPWRHACADDMHDLNAWSCRSVWLAVSGDSMQTNVSVNTRKAMSKHGRQRASRAFNEERQINDTSDFTETFRCSLYRINQTTKNLQRGCYPAWIWEMLVRRITETSFSSRFSISWNKLSFFSWKLKNKPSAAAALTQDMITHKKVWTLSQTHIYVRTHTHGVCPYMCTDRP